MFKLKIILLLLFYYNSLNYDFFIVFLFWVFKMNVQESFNKFIKDSKRVLKVSRKPDLQEYKELAKVVSIGVLIVGAIGFVIVLAGSLIGL